MLHLYFLSVGPVLDPVVTVCCSPPVAVVRGSVAGVRGAAPLWILWRQDDLSPPAAPAVSVAYSRRLQYLLLLRWLLFDRLDRLQWLSFQWLQ